MALLMWLAVYSVVFWIGDLNYRISEIDSEVCKQMITKGQLEHLLKNNDQVDVLFSPGLFVVVLLELCSLCSYLFVNTDCDYSTKSLQLCTVCSLLAAVL